MKTIKFGRVIPALGVCSILAAANQVQATTTLLDDHFDNGVVGTGGAGNFNGGFTGVEIGGPNTGFSVSESGTLVTHTATGTNNLSGLFSLNAFDPTAYTSFTATWVVSSYQDPAGAGFNLVISSDASLSTPHVQFRFELGNNADFNLQTNDGSTLQSLVSGDAIDTGQSRDGFTLTATFDAVGISYSTVGLASLDDSVGTIAYTGGQTYSSLFNSTTHIGATTQATGVNDTNFVLDRITVTGVPEPSSTVLIAGVFGMALLRRRRR